LYADTRGWNDKVGYDELGILHDEPSMNMPNRAMKNALDRHCRGGMKVKKVMNILYDEFFFLLTGQTAK
jgi:hypothetical protein